MAAATLQLSKVVCASGLCARPGLVRAEAKPQASLAQGRRVPQTVCNAAPVSTFFVTNDDEKDSNVDLSLLPLADSEDMAILHVGEGIALAPMPTEEGATESNVLPPTPVLPSGSMMAEFLTAYRSMLLHEPGTGTKAAATGARVLERIRIGLLALLGHPKHGAFAGVQWHKLASDLESCLDELEKDLALMHSYHDRQPTRLALQMTRLHCDEAARILRRL